MVSRRHWGDGDSWHILFQIRRIRFGIGGGIVSALCLPTFISVARFMSGDNMLPLTKLLSTGLLLLARKSADEFGLLEGAHAAPSMQQDREGSAASV